MKSARIIHSNDLRADNRHRILKSLRNKGPLSRAEIGKLTGHSQAALSTQFGIMIEQGVTASESITAEFQKQ